MKILGEVKNGNYIVQLWSDGTKVRYNNLDCFEPEKPESIDLKITNCCYGVNGKLCSQCHEKSTPNGKEGDIMNLKFIDTMLPYSEVACLSGDTIVHSENGSIEISKLKAGDKIYDSDYELRTIVNIQTSNKNTIRIKGNKGINIVCSEDHPFISNGSEVCASNMIGKVIDNISQYENTNDAKYTIDMAKHIHEANVDLQNSHGGKLFDDNTVRLRNCTKPIPRYITLSNDLMWLYGLFVAEGSRKSIVLNINETDYANRAIKIWDDTFGLGARIYTNEQRHSVTIEFETASLIEDLFVSEMKVGVGARNKSLRYLYNINNKELVRQALIGLYNGDGCIRERNNEFGGKAYNTSLKTTSKYLAYDVSYLLAKWFGIYATVYHGMSPKRKIENRTLEESDYYSVEFYGYDNCMKIFYDQYNYQKPIQKQHKPKSYSKVNSIEDEEPQILYDITLDNGSHIFPVNGYFLTHNCGGGDPLTHPNLVPFLEKLKERKLIANMTVNQWSFMQNPYIIDWLVKNELIHGLGVSLNDVTDEFIDEIQKYPNAVIHLINGIATIDQLKRLSGHHLKLLFLGFKNFGRGELYYKALSGQVEALKSQFYDMLPEIINEEWFDCVSFDNLAIEQLEPKRLMNEDEYQRMYMGNDGQFTMYVDAVNMEFAKSSVSTERYPIEDDIKTMFDKVRSV